MEYFYELFIGLPRGGPGDNKSTRKAFQYLKEVPLKPLILDIGCGPGMQTLELARITDGKIIALDNYQPFLDKLMKEVTTNSLKGRIIPKNQSMFEMDFADNSFDIIWSEGALYQMGFQNGLKRCHQLLKKKGYLVVTEAVYLKSTIPDPLKKFWEDEYPDIKDIQHNIIRIQNEGFSLLTHFTLPPSSWIDNFYLPMGQRIIELKKKYKNNAVAFQVLDKCEEEIKVYHKYSDYFGYEFFIMQKK